MLILDIGCGKKKQVSGSIGLDRQPGSDADVLCELAHFPWPLRDSCADQIYLSHFIEHLLFKGTESRSAEDIARAIDGVGGSLDAFTSRENTCFYAKVLGEHLPLAVDLLSDLLLHPKLDPEDVEKERRVVLEEIKMVEDDPDDEVDRLFADAVIAIGEYDRASASLLQRRLKIGYARAARIIDQLEARGYVGTFDGSNARPVLRRDEPRASARVAPDLDEDDR